MVAARCERTRKLNFFRACYPINLVFSCGSREKKNTMANIGPQMIDSTDANGATTRELFNILKQTFEERSLTKATKKNVGRNYLQTARGTGLPYEISGYHCSSNTPRW
jgi:hypothetical protein